MYGMGAKLMSTILGVEVDECINILDEFYKMFPTVKQFTLHNEKFAKEHNYVEDYMGRRRHLPDINLPQVKITSKMRVPLYDADLLDIPVGDLINGKRSIEIRDTERENYWKNEYSKMMGETYKYNNKVTFKNRVNQEDGDRTEIYDNGAFISKATTQCTNATIQGGAATLTKKAMVSIFTNKRLNELGFRLLVPVHDELLGECPAEYASEVEKLLSNCMIDAAKPECSVNMKVDTYVVKHWYADEVSNSICDEYKQFVNGNKKKNLEPISREEAINKIVREHGELTRDTIISMCDGKFDCVTGDV